MARTTIKMPDEFLMRISALGDKLDTIVPRVLDVGGKVVLDKVKDNLSSVIGSGTKYDSRSTGELVRSMGVSPAKQDRYGNWNVKVGLSEPRSDTKATNALIANVLEYGKHGQPAKPFLKPARSSSRSACTDAMIAKLEEEINKV